MCRQEGFSTMLARMIRVLGILPLAAWVGATLVLADWPTARGNGGRTGITPVEPPAPLVAGWTMSTPAPSPAWAGEARGSLWQKLDQPLFPRAADDLAPAPIIAGGLVLVGTTDGEVRAVELTTGRLRWRYFCGGPVRFAPAASGDRVFVGSDDGLVHALRLESGASLWTARIGPERPLISGNGRLVSPCPVRTGLLVSGDTIHVAAGLFPVEGTYLAALDARDGGIRWRRSLGSVSPQGYLADAGADLVVPVGRASPKRYRKRDGAFVRDVTSASGTFAVVSGEETLAGPGATGQMAAGDLRSGARLVSFPGRALAVTPETTYLLNGRDLTALDRERMRASSGNLPEATRWSVPCRDGAAVAVAGSRVFGGGRDSILVLDATTGKVLQTLPVNGTVVSLAVDAAGVVAVTGDGWVHAFLGKEIPQGVPPDPEPPMPSPGSRARVTNWLRQLASPHGFALWVNPTDGLSDLRALVADSGLHVVLAVPSGEVDALRHRVADAGWPGSRVAVVGRSADGGVPAASHLFNLVIAGDLPEAEARRLACPHPAGVIVREGQATAAPAARESGAWTHLYGTAANTCASEQPLQGHPRLQWFGGHGPERMPDRHTRGHAPLAAGGLLLSMAENAVIATDAWNGTVRWVLELPDSMRYAMPYDAGYAALHEDGQRAFLAVNEALWEVDARTGQVAQRHPVPVAGLHWGWAALESGVLFGSAQAPGAARTGKVFELVDLDYRSERPMVCSRAMFRKEDADGTGGWLWESEGLLVNPTLAVSGQRVFAVEALASVARSRASDRLTCEQILEEARVVCLDAVTGGLVWSQPLRWPEARDILGLTVTGDRLVLSAARSVDGQAEYRLRCWSAADGSPRWEAQGLNPVKDLYHGQQVKRPVILGDRVSFESDLFDLATGRRWVPPGAAPDWILARPGHACGGMTGGRDGLLFRADNPTLFRLSDGTFTRLSPTRPGCWLNILPAACGVLIPEASASCICEYPIQASLGFAFQTDPVPMLPDLITTRP